MRGPDGCLHFAADVIQEGRGFEDSILRCRVCGFEGEEWFFGND